MVNKRVQNAVLGCNLKNDRMISVCYQGKLFNITVSKSMPQPVMSKKLKFSDSIKTYKTCRMNTKQKYPFNHRGLECKSRKSRDTWSINQVWPWSTKWSRAKVNRVCQDNTLVTANTLFQQHKRWLYTWTSPDGKHWNQIDYVFAAKDGEALYSQQKQDQELTVAQIMNCLLPNSDLNRRK